MGIQEEAGGGNRGGNQFDVDPWLSGCGEANSRLGGGTEAPSAASEDGDAERCGDEAAGAHVVAGVGGGLRGGPPCGRRRRWRPKVCAAAQIKVQ